MKGLQNAVKNLVVLQMSREEQNTSWICQMPLATENHISYSPSDHLQVIDMDGARVSLRSRTLKDRIKST